jgi:uncharacterized membrane protein YkoI
MKTSKAILVLSAALGAGTSVYADKVTFSQVPPTVQQAIKARSGSHEIEDIDRDNRNGQTTYEASWKNNSGVQQELLVSDNGSVLRDVAGDGPATASTSTATTSAGWRPRFGTADANLQLSGGVKLPLNQAPQAVQETVTQMTHGAPVEDFERGMANGRTVYEAAFKRNGQNTELQVYDDGSLVRRFPFNEGRGSRASTSAATSQTFNGPRYAGLADKNQSLSNLKDLSLNQAPAPVQSTVNYMASGARITGFESGTWNGRTVYDAQYTQNGKFVELQVLEDGSILPRDPATVTGSTTPAVPSKAPWRQTLLNEVGNRLGLNSSPSASATSLSLSQTPAAVQQTVNQATKGAAIQSLQQEQWNGRTVYSADFQQNSQNMRLQVLDDGSILNMGPTTAVGGPASGQTGSGRQ